MKYTVEKIRRRLWNEIVSRTRKSSFYPFIYKSYWHSLLFPQKEEGNNIISYLSAIPNPGAGIGHQIANWIAGYWFAKKFQLRFAHIPFSNLEWEDFLGFKDKEVTVKDLVQKQDYKKVLLPLFDESSINEVELIKKIIGSYRTKKVVFIAEQDQFYKDQFRVIDNLKQKFYQTKTRENNNLIYSNDFFNIAIHIRRGDIVAGQKNKDSNLLSRWQDNNYFEKVLSNALGYIKPIKPVAIYLFSQGDSRDFKEFHKFNNLHLCLDMNTQSSFLHMVYSDLLITSKSSFSYKPALLNNGIKICPKDFWHGYPKSKDWILVDEIGNLLIN
ncbi:hypothetical protein [Emticicia agri]|uniref:Glycosyl transferase family 11 n=1 Tax=Emticicia agri TaxID=2492393 RepID=A0A4Q5LW08_9BACT|nr:hypothetical protein [Emticicia agri]RYU93717.1 hypothetical protein EWM59_20580 [Emticicia agri]